MEINLERDVLPVLQPATAAAVVALVQHPRNTRGLACGQHGFKYVHPTTGKVHALRGITGVLETLFWVPYKYAGARRKSIVSSSASHAGPYTAVSGAVRGSLVHQHLHDLVTLDKASFWRRNQQGLHPWMTGMMQALLQRGRRPLAAEFMVWDESLALGTAIDLLAIDLASGTLEFYELKTGYASDSDWFGGTGSSMRGALARVMHDTPRYRAWVQVVAGAMLAVHGHEITGAPVSCWVVRLNESHPQGQFEQVPPAVVEKLGLLVWATLVAYRR